MEQDSRIPPALLSSSRQPQTRTPTLQGSLRLALSTVAVQQDTDIGNLERCALHVNLRREPDTA